jgi:hypothetical protein
MEPPPGGPPDNTPPRVIATRPESLVVAPGFEDEVEFRFGEVVSEGSSPSEGLGTGDLERLIILSPDSQVPDVSWRRSRVGVRPRDGWRPNTVYRVELLPGLLDLRRNRADSGRVVTFTTGAALPTAELSGRIGDWTTGNAAARALVEAVLLPDSLGYRAVADSTGRYRLGPLPSGEYLVYGVVDQNSDHRRQPRESFDTARVASGAAAPIVVWAFPRDTSGPRVQSVAARDSMAATITFTQFLDPAQELGPDAVRLLLLPDSTPVPVLSILSRSRHDSVYAPAPVPAADSAAVVDSAAARPAPADSLPARPRPARDTALAPVPAPARAPALGQRAADAAAPADSFRRPPLQKDLVLRVASPMTPGRSYLLTVLGVRNASGVAADAGGGFAVPERPKPAAADTVAQPDSLAPPADTAGAVRPPRRVRPPADSLRP